ncbi:hypothetical protein BGW39_002487 [Mortierella sp. 14UC]|nr:hypothetical protein BGW39_002487 [Mortierella sp. 14UC]
MSNTCDVDPDLITKVEAFRFAKRSQGNAALICKIDKDKLLIVEDEDEDNLSIEDLVELLPENTPRYVVLSFEGVKPELNMLYASAKTYFQNKVGLGKVLDLQDAESLTEDWLRSKLLK